MINLLMAAVFSLPREKDSLGFTPSLLSSFFDGPLRNRKDEVDQRHESSREGVDKGTMNRQDDAAK